ncbi:MAG TPA: helix-turn-helix transcriptional regulator [Byssovorax sp.]
MQTDVSQILDVLEAAYQQIPDDASWLHGVASRFDAALGDGSGTIAVLQNLEPGAPRRFEEAVGVGMGDWWRQQLAVFENIPRSTYQAFARGGSVYYWSQLHEAITAHEPEAAAYFAAQARAMFGMTDAELFARARAGDPIYTALPLERMGIACLDGGGRGVGVVIPLRRVAERPLSDAERDVWGRVAAHVATAARLRRRSAGDEAPIEAVVTPSGRVEHAVGAATSARAREILRAAAVSQDRARARGVMGRDLAFATEHWRALVAGRWSLVDAFERDGRRYLVARANEPRVGGHARLTAREAQVASYVALGHANKLIAYELGLSPATIAGHVARAQKKLGATSRAELVLLLRDARG